MLVRKFVSTENILDMKLTNLLIIAISLMALSFAGCSDDDLDPTGITTLISPSQHTPTTIQQ